MRIELKVTNECSFLNVRDCTVCFEFDKDGNVEDFDLYTDKKSMVVGELYQDKFEQTFTYSENGLERLEDCDMPYEDDDIIMVGRVRG